MTADDPILGAAVSPIEAPPKMTGYLNKTHDLKCWPPFFSEILAGSKSFELRKNDRDYRCGDTLLLREWEPNEETYTGRELRVEVNYILNKSIFGLQDGFCILGFRASGQRVVVDPKTHATIPKWQIDRVKALIIDTLWPTSPPVNDAVFLELKGMFAGWLSHSSPEGK
jgi:hypothetical protein